MEAFLEETQHLKIQLEEIKSATNNFDDKNVIGRGGFGKVYKGVLSHSKGQSMVAFKRLDRRYGQGNPEFLKEILTLFRYKHENLISLHGFCDEDCENILVYEHAYHGSLDRHLGATTLTWLKRLKICLAAAKGLCYLHDPRGSEQRVIHRDIKSSNILLDKSWNAKLSDMGLSKIGPANQQGSFVATNVVGTPGYIDPVYMETYFLTKESDVYSFGIVLFEVLCGRLCFEYNNGHFLSLWPMWKKSYEEKKLGEIIFEDLKEQMNLSSLEKFSAIAYRCLQKFREERPKMSSVVEELEIALHIQKRDEVMISRLKLKMALKLPAAEAANVAIQSIGCGYDISLDLRLKYHKGDYFSDVGTNQNRNCCLIEIEEDEGRDIVLPGGLLIPNVSKSIKCDKGERTRFRSDVLSFQQMSEQFNQEISLTGKIPSGLFNTMFEFSGSWQKDASSTKTLAFDGVFISLYTVALEKSQIVLCDHVKKAVPSSWEPALLARFIETYGTHIIVGVKMGGKDVIYMKQQHASSLEPADVQNKLKAMADKRFVDSDGQFVIDSDHIFQKDKYDTRELRLRFADIDPSSSYSYKEDPVIICKRRGGSDDRNLKHNEWLHSVQLEPDVITMSFIPITSLLNGVSGSGYLSHAINLYLRYKPPIEELHQFLEFQLPRQWAPVFSDLPLGPQHKQQSTASLQFSFFGPKLYVNTNPVDVGKRPVTGLRLYLEGKTSNCLAIHLQHLSSLPKVFQLEEDLVTGIFNIYDRKYYEKVQWKHFSHVCTAPVESEDEHSIVTGAHLHVEDHGFKVLFLRLNFSKLLGCTETKNPEWDGSPGLAQISGLISTLTSHHFTEVSKPPPQPVDINVNSALYPEGQPSPLQAPKLLKFVDATEMTRGPQESPGYWVVSGARLVVDKGKISLRVKYSLLTSMLPDEEEVED